LGNLIFLFPIILLGVAVGIGLLRRGSVKRSFQQLADEVGGTFSESGRADQLLRFLTVDRKERSRCSTVLEFSEGTAEIAVFFHNYLRRGLGKTTNPGDWTREATCTVIDKTMSLPSFELEPRDRIWSMGVDPTNLGPNYLPLVDGDEVSKRFYIQSTTPDDFWAFLSPNIRQVLLLLRKQGQLHLVARGDRFLVHFRRRRPSIREYKKLITMALAFRKTIGTQEGVANKINGE